MAKTLTQYKDLSRLPAANHLRSALSVTGRYNPLALFERKAFGAWLRSTWRYAIARVHPFEPAAKAPNGTSLYQVPDTFLIALAGDWGTGSDEAARIATEMLNDHESGPPDFTIHLGDVYYVGDSRELEENCLGGGNHAKKAPQDCVRWPLGTRGSFALQGNHEMFADGMAYFDEFLPRLGVGDPPKGQGASFFCLENDFWRIIGVDTGYHSVSHTPFLRLFWDDDCALEPALIDWLRNVVQPGRTPKATVLLSRHQYFSAFDKEYPKPEQQLNEFFPSPVIWFWGHEHRLSGYKLFGPGKMQVHGRCVGHGGMPIELESVQQETAAAKMLLFYDGRINPLYTEDKLGYNGFAFLRFDANKLTVDYRSLVVAAAGSDDRYEEQSGLLRTETFEWDGKSFQISNVTNFHQSEVFVAND
jgi:Calcineurin-like phosphoesterase